METIEELKKHVENCRYMAAFTGAGISADSGIPTYRGEDGYWSKYDPGKYADVNYFMQDPSYYWQFFRDVRYPALAAAKPNKAHKALASLEKRGKLKAVITQNIDGLHQVAGTEEVLELHGNTRKFNCMSCRKVFDLEAAHALLGHALPPECDDCGGLIRPQVVFFGESLPQDVLYRAQRESARCDLFLVIGSSLVVHPAASLPLVAAENGARLVIVNKEATPLDQRADLVIRDGAASVLKVLL
ncbi:MAG: SIR2 family NAD-dependent protein deacylase [Thermodesulfobacteriota bacterium]